ncbi:hypothetical protein BD324DRAFT_620453 [Kockovaella imperatae]|uniref:Transmembrane protein n=1 Tax=Kockovaella imperatae TaxID=4999 RepID=A0A1Y1UK12_9TREE|nr:hypothetical protein BD324DRAFT_620453 [Kockovaella imperatae]ORX38329.1 hypothetical protein BD324DRAFT_620453 [Kockovaella imperatae]
MSSSATASATDNIHAQSSKHSRLDAAKTNLQYLALGNKGGAVPASLTTRSALTTTRYVIRYAIRRLIRYAKYAAVGAIVAALGGTLLGTLGSGIAFFAAPSIPVGMGIGVITAMVKFGWRHRGNHFRGGGWEGMKARAAEGQDGAKDEESDAVENQRQSERAWQRRREDVWMRA